MTRAEWAALLFLTAINVTATVISGSLVAAAQAEFRNGTHHIAEFAAEILSIIRTIEKEAGDE